MINCKCVTSTDSRDISGSLLNILLGCFHSFVGVGVILNFTCSHHSLARSLSKEYTQAQLEGSWMKTTPDGWPFDQDAKERTCLSLSLFLSLLAAGELDRIMATQIEHLPHLLETGE